MTRTLALAALALAVAGCSTVQDRMPLVSRDPSLAEVRRAAMKYQDFNVALAEGYVTDPAQTCETASHMGKPASDGAMGVHYFRPDLLGITEPPNPRVTGNGTHTDFLKPAVLLYEPQADGSMVLVGVENLVFEDSWKAAGNTAPPKFRGRDWDYMADDPSTEVDEAHGFAPHYDRHVWVFRKNPRGVFTGFNPAVTCEHSRSAMMNH